MQDLLVPTFWLEKNFVFHYKKKGYLEQTSRFHQWILNHTHKGQNKPFQHPKIVYHLKRCIYSLWFVCQNFNVIYNLVFLQKWQWPNMIIIQNNSYQSLHSVFLERYEDPLKLRKTLIASTGTTFSYLLVHRPSCDLTSFHLTSLISPFSLRYNG